MAKILMIFPESFTPPADHGATACSRPPPRILLELDAYLVDRRNATTATATSWQGHTIQVSFYAAGPPAMSYLCVHCPGSKPNDPAFKYEPRVVGAEGRFVLLRVRFAHTGHDNDEYFMYKADPKSPSLENLGRPRHRVPLFKQLAVVPLGDDGDHYLLAGSIAIRELHIYSSADQTWSIKPLPDARPAGHHMLPDKVITLGDGVVGWVDLRVGVAVCDLLREPLEVRFIPLPVPMPANRERLKRHPAGTPQVAPWLFRDVAFCNGVLKFVEVEHRWIVTTIDPAPEEPTDPREKAVLLDSDLMIMSRKRKEVDAKPKQVRKRDGWTMLTWSRPAMSSNCWHKGCTIDVDDIAVDDTTTSSLRSAIVGDEHDESFKFRNMYSAFPTLSTDVDDLVYLRTTATHPKAWMVAVDLGKKTLTALGAYSLSRHDPCAYSYRLCSLSNYLNMDPADSSQATKLKDSADPLKTRQSSAEEVSCPHKDKPRAPWERKAQEQGAESDDEECRGDDSSDPPLARRQRNCLPQPPVDKQSDGAGDRPNPPDVSNVVARPTGGSSSLLPQVPVPPQQVFFGQWSGAGNHPNAHAFNHHHPNAHVVSHHLHGATGLGRSCPPPQLPVPQQNMSYYWNGVSYQQNHPWPPPHQQQQYVPQAQQWNGVAGGYQVQEQHHLYRATTPAAGYYYSPSANVNLQNYQWGVGYGHHSAPNLPARGMHPAAELPNQPAWAPEAEFPVRQGPAASKKDAASVSNQLR